MQDNPGLKQVVATELVCKQQPENKSKPWLQAAQRFAEISQLLGDAPGPAG